jgi:hypothetical protein
MLSYKLVNGTLFSVSFPPQRNTGGFSIPYSIGMSFNGRSRPKFALETSASRARRGGRQSVPRSHVVLRIADEVDYSPDSSVRWPV